VLLLFVRHTEPQKSKASLQRSACLCSRTGSQLAAAPSFHAPLVARALRWQQATQNSSSEQQEDAWRADVRV
jgi:hypothetical protein